MDPSLLTPCGITDPIAWRRRWCDRLDSAPPSTSKVLAGLQPSMLWSVALPLLERLRVLADGGVRPLLALNGPVGAGKSTLARCLGALGPELGLELAVASIDDAYLPWQERCCVLAGNPFGVTRVPPGSHDTALLRARLMSWKGGGPLELPRFDKTLRGGEGDRCGGSCHQADAVVLEGWLLGCRSLGSTLAAVIERFDQDPALARLSPEERLWLPRWDEALQHYAPLGDPAHGLVDGLWVLHPCRWSLPLRWRLQAEARQRAAGGATLPPRAVVAIVRATLAALPPPLYQDPLLDRADAVAMLDGRRRCLRSWRPAAAQSSASASSRTG
ncbi:MAG: hypothetical protein VKL23_05290 [Cyanobacteriota bacterium]|nr:hypothetical protein [Cyanobacteriota bacterium]